MSNPHESDEHAKQGKCFRSVSRIREISPTRRDSFNGFRVVALARTWPLIARRFGTLDNA